MSILTWGERDYEVGVDKGVFFSSSGVGQAWNGLVSVSDELVDLRQLVRYQDGVKTLNRSSGGDYRATVEAFAYPDELEGRREFGFTWRVQTNDGYLTHLVYNARGWVKEKSYEYQKISPFSIDISTRPVRVPGSTSCAHLVVDARKAYPQALQTFETILYGNEDFDARLPNPEEVISIFEANAKLRVIDHGDGSFTVEGPDDAIAVFADGTFRIDWPSAIFVSSDTYTIRSF